MQVRRIHPHALSQRSAQAVVLIPLLGLSAWLHMVLGSAGDKSWLLMVARMMLEGKRLYVDVVEVNPPLILWLYAIPAWLALHLPSWRDFEFLTLIGFFVAVLCAYLGR